jgi:hypothetical protein
MAQHISPLINLSNSMDSTLNDSTSPQTSMLTGSIADRNNVKYYSQWVNTKFAPPGIITKLSAKIMSPFCSNPIIGFILLIGWIIFFIYITWYVTNGKCNDLDDAKLQKISDLISQQEIGRLNSLNSSLLSSFKSEIDMNMINEQRMFDEMSMTEKNVYLMMNSDGKSKIFNLYVSSLK